MTQIITNKNLINIKHSCRSVLFVGLAFTYSAFSQLVLENEYVTDTRIIESADTIKVQNNCIIGVGGDVMLKAKNEIRLKPGFFAQSGSVFHAKIVDTDTDSDGLIDTWEINYFGDISLHNAESDPDMDGLSNGVEQTNKTNPLGFQFFVHNDPINNYDGLSPVFDGVHGPGNNIQDAVNTVPLASDGYIIQVAPGTYAENINFNGKSFTLTSENPADPGVVNATIISGGDSGRVITFSNGELNSAILTGFTITNGSDVTGAGIYCYNASSPIISNCNVSGNTATDSGGGIYIGAGSSPAITDCTFALNTADRGGGMYIINSSNPAISDSDIVDNSNGGGIYIENSSPVFDTCLIQRNRNQLGSGGGGIEIINSDNLSFTSCTISENDTAKEGGGVFCIQSSPQFTACVFNNNKANDPIFGTGGGMCAINNSQPAITDCIFKNNESIADGGGLAFDQSSSLIINCEIRGNTAGKTGGAIISRSSATTLKNCRIFNNSSLLSGGAISSYLNDDLTLNNCVISSNSTTINGGAIYTHSNCNIKVYNSTLTANIAGAEGGGIWIDGTESDNTVTLSNSIFWNNDAATHDEISIFNNTDPDITYCLINGGKVNFTLDTLTNISGNTDPLLLNVAGQDFRLTADSPCIDAGTDTNAPATDFDNEVRVDNPNFLNTDNSIVDIGSDEYVDTDADNIPDFWEFAYGLNANISDVNIDTDGDGLFNIDEFMLQTDPLNLDTDGDNISDAWEDGNNLNPKVVDLTNLTFSPSVNAIEDVSNGKYVIDINHPLIVDIIVNFTLSGTAIADFDYTSIGNSFVIPVNQTAKEINVNYISDLNDEIDKTLTLAIESVDNSNISIPPPPDDTSTLTIIDNDMTLTILQTNGGVATPSGTTILDTENDIPFAINANPLPGFVFNGWMGDTSAIADINAVSTTISASTDATISASFSHAQIEIVNELNNNSSFLSIPEGEDGFLSLVLSGTPPVSEPITLEIIKLSGDTDISFTTSASLIFDSIDWSGTRSIIFTALKDNNDIENGSAQYVVRKISGSNPINDRIFTITEIDDDFSLTVNSSGNGSTNPQGTVIIDPGHQFAIIHFCSSQYRLRIYSLDWKYFWSAIESII